MTEKIEIELDQDKKDQIDIIAKAFNITPIDFIKGAIVKEIGFIKDTLERNNAKNDLQEYYKLEIDMDTLKNLSLRWDHLKKIEKGICESCGQVRDVQWIRGMPMCEECSKKTPEPILQCPTCSEIYRKNEIDFECPYCHQEIYIEELLHKEKTSELTLSKGGVIDILEKKETKTTENQIKISYDIHLKCSEKALTLLKENNIKFQVWELHELDEDEYDPCEELPFVEVESEIYQKLKRLSEVTEIPIESIVSSELGDFFNSVGDIPVIFLDRHLGIKNIKNPIEMLEKMDEVIHIGPGYLEELKTMDLVKHVDNWHHPSKTKNYTVL